MLIRPVVESRLERVDEQCVAEDIGHQRFFHLCASQLDVGQLASTRGNGRVEEQDVEGLFSLEERSRAIDDGFRGRQVQRDVIQLDAIQDVVCGRGILVVGCRSEPCRARLRCTKDKEFEFFGWRRTSGADVDSKASSRSSR